VGNVPEEPIEDYPDDQQGGETAQLTSAYPIQKSCSFVTFHFPGSLHLRRLIGETSGSLTMSAVSSSFLRTLLYALIEERHFALVDGLRFPTLGSL